MHNFIQAGILIYTRRVAGINTYTNQTVIINNIIIYKYYTATYIITSDSSKEDNGGSVHVLKNGLRAEIVLALGEDINLKCFGLYGDEIHDDAPAFKRGFDFCKQIKGGTIRWQGIAALNEPLIIDSHYINLQGYGYGSTLKANFERDYVLAISYEEYSTTEEIQQILIGNFRINGNRVAKHGLVVDDYLPIYNTITENIYISDTMDYGIVIYGSENNHYNLITVENCYGGIKLIGHINNTSFNNCEFKECTINEPLKITYYQAERGEKLIVETRTSMVEFNNCYFGNSESKILISIDKSIDVDFNKCVFDLKQTLCEDYAIVVGEYALYTRFIDCFLNGLDKTCGILKNEGPNTEIRNLKGVDIKSNIHVLSNNTIHISDLNLVGDSTPLVIYTPNDDKSMLDIDSVIKTVNDDTIVFPSNANFYNIYMNQKDEVGIKGKLNNYILDKHLENEVFENVYTKHDSDIFDIDLKLPSEGVWDLDLFLNIDDGNQGKICKYQATFKQNSVYSFANVQELTNTISWGNNIELTTPTIDRYGNMKFNFKDTTETNRSTWTLKLKAKRVIGFN